MVRVFIILILFSFNSCRMPLNQYMQPQRVKIKRVLNVPDSLYQQIDTLALYEYISYKYGDKYYNPNYKAYIRFFSNGKYVFSHGDRITLSKEYFRPARGKQGSYFINRKGLLTYTLITSGEGHGYTYRESFKVTGDSLPVVHLGKRLFI